MIIGITGGSGAGKSTASAFFRKNGYYIADTDKIGHSVILPGKNAYIELINVFGNEILNNDKTVNRKKLGSIVFSDSDKLKELNRITHFYITEDLKKIIKENKNVAIDGALLIESGISKMCDKVIFVSCPLEERIQRIIKRDGIKREDAVKRINNQNSDAFYRKNCDIEIVNDGKTNIENQLEVLL